MVTNAKVELRGVFRKVVVLRAQIMEVEVGTTAYKLYRETMAPTLTNTVEYC